MSLLRAISYLNMGMDSDLRHFSSLAGIMLYLAGRYLILDVSTSQNAFMGALPVTWRPVSNMLANCNPPPQEAKSRH